MWSMEIGMFAAFKKPIFKNLDDKNLQQPFQEGAIDEGYSEVKPQSAGGWPLNYAQDALCIMHEMRHAAHFVRVLYGCLICESAGRGVRAAQFLLHTPATPLREVANCLLLCRQLPCLSSFLDIYLAHVATK